MATHYDLQQQEQLATLKDFWGRWGTWITVALAAIVLLVAGWNGYNYWQARQSSRAAEVMDQLVVATGQTETGAVLQSMQTLQSNFPRTAQAAQASLLAGKYLSEQEEWAQAEGAFDWVRSNAKDAGFQALAALHKSALQMQQKQWDAALATLDGHSFPYEFHALQHDRRGDVLLRMGRQAEAITAYNQAFEAFDVFTRYRSVVEAKLNALGEVPALLRGGA